MRRILVPIRTRTIEIEISSDLNSDEMSGRGEKKAFLKMAGDKNCPRKKSVLLPMLLGCTYERELYFAIERTRFVKNRAVRAKEALDENTLQHNFWYALFIAPSPDIPRWVKSMLDYFLEKWMLFKDSLNRFAHDRSHVTRVFSLFHRCNETCMYIYICIGHIIGDQFIGQYVIMRNKI